MRVFVILILAIVALASAKPSFKRTSMRGSSSRLSSLIGSLSRKRNFDSLSLLKRTEGPLNGLSNLLGRISHKRNSNSLNQLKRTGDEDDCPSDIESPCQMENEEEFLGCFHSETMAFADYFITLYKDHTGEDLLSEADMVIMYLIGESILLSEEQQAEIEEMFEDEIEDRFEENIDWGSFEPEKLEEIMVKGCTYEALEDDASDRFGIGEKKK